MLVLVKSDRFPWNGGLMGRSVTITWAGWEPDTMHWSTMACSLWTHLHVITMAHELGHCFGLQHTGSADINYDGSDNTIDLMATNWFGGQSSLLKPSNKARINHHFRDLEEETPAMSLVPTSRTF